MSKCDLCGALKPDFCDTCGAEVFSVELNEYFECQRCVENRASSQEEMVTEEGAPFSLDEQHEAARKLKDGQ